MVAMKSREMVAMRPRKNGGNEAEKKWWQWNRGNSGNEAKSSDFYKQSMVFEKFFGRNNATNCCVMCRMNI